MNTQRNMDFQDPINRKSYSERSIDPEWQNTLSTLIDVSGLSVVDIGCGGGLYSNVLAELGAGRVIGLDSSAEMVRTAIENNRFPERLEFRVGDALAIPLENQSADFILERAVIHHLTALERCFEEAYRVLRANGSFLIQDRTPEDCLAAGSQDHIRGYFFECFPRLKEIEARRRHAQEIVTQGLKSVGFRHIQIVQLWEVRRVYNRIEELRDDLLLRKGRSLLHALDDRELHTLVDFIEGKINPASFPLEEKDRWTLWLAVK